MLSWLTSRENDSLQVTGGGGSELIPRQSKKKIKYLALMIIKNILF